MLLFFYYLKHKQAIIKVNRQCFGVMVHSQGKVNRLMQKCDFPTVVSTNYYNYVVIVIVAVIIIIIVVVVVMIIIINYYFYYYIIIITTFSLS